MNMRRHLFLWNAIVATLGGSQWLILVINMRSTFRSLYAAIGGRYHNFFCMGDRPGGVLHGAPFIKER